MGDPRKLRKKYSTPSHPWQKQRIDEEKVLMREYGFKNKKELWKLNSKLKNYKSQVKALISKKDDTSNKKKLDLIKRMQGYNLLSQNAVLEDILSINLKDICERRLQTIVVKKSLARSIKQARQFITHEHVSVGERKITSPSYIVSQGEELVIKISASSPLFSEDHPERIPVQAQLKKEMQEAGIKSHEEKEEVKKEIKEVKKPVKKEVKKETKIEVKEEKKSETPQVEEKEEKISEEVAKDE